uniref:pseudouridine synthase n=1 Tax=Ningiella ruwaisensis TaxID=2364274 RepID=UPI0010A0452A|nr:pseudouridine synthase [Ningiella ruwaisensis]
MQPIPVLYRDSDIIVVHKPSGLLVHRSLIDKRETEFLVQRLRDQIGQYVYSVHRLDKPTSGLLVMALSSEVARQLSAQFEQQLVEKRYVALVRGFVNEAQCIDYPLLEKLDKMTDNMDKVPESKPAISYLEPLAHLELPFPVSKYQTGRFSLVELSPKTGRKHQLRRHMAHIRHPIIGDTTHGDGKQNRYISEHFGIRRLALCAKMLGFKHPTDGKHTSLKIETMLDDDLGAIQLALDQFCVKQFDALSDIRLFTDENLF